MSELERESTLHPYRVEPDIDQIDAEFRRVWDGECICCYVYRLVGSGCHGDRFIVEYLRQIAPDQMQLRGAIRDMDALCDCELGMRAYTFRSGRVTAPNDEREKWESVGLLWVDHYTMTPRCEGVERGALTPCPVWIRNKWLHLMPRPADWYPSWAGDDDVRC